VTPIVTIAPMFTIWFGFGALPKVLIAALITFFPVLINAITGFRSVNAGALDVMRSVHASPAAIFFKLRLPSALPYLFSALKVAVTLSLIGAVVAEWSGSGQGLGRVILLAHSNLDLPVLFAGVVTLATLGITLTALLTLLERRMLFWHEAFLLTGSAEPGLPFSEVGGTDAETALLGFPDDAPGLRSPDPGLMPHRSEATR
jgi:NitT/TauT family transport system permease protein